MIARLGKSGQAFSILEVMIAVAILGIALTAIFSSEAGAIHMANRAKKTSVAAILARCKMGEIEERLAREGMPALSLDGEDSCCEDADIKDYVCTWKVTRIHLPTSTLTGEDSPPDSAGSSSNAGATMPPATGAEVEPRADAPSLSEQAGAILDEQSLQSGDFTQLALQYVYPLLAPTIEEQVRRVEIAIEWKEGTRKQSFSLVQYMVSPNTVPTALQQLQQLTPTEEGDKP
ncbi:MAG: type II secretion system protein [Myxococcales bacterium]|nr:type II secretion system protein [Myxococcales bacterium]MCB9709268.1 type II secretion system protein [Myxococcales bacterium]